MRATKPPRNWRASDAVWHRMLPCAVPKAWMRTNMRSKPSPQRWLWGLADRAAWMGKAHGSGRAPVPVIVAAPVAAPAAAAAPAIEPLPAEAKSTAKGKIIEEQTPEPVIEEAAQPAKHSRSCRDSAGARPGNRARAATTTGASRRASHRSSQRTHPFRSCQRSSRKACPVTTESFFFSCKCRAFQGASGAAHALSVPAEPQVKTEVAKWR